MTNRLYLYPVISYVLTFQTGHIYDCHSTSPFDHRHTFKHAYSKTDKIKLSFNRQRITYLSATQIYITSCFHNYFKDMSVDLSHVMLIKLTIWSVYKRRYACTFGHNKLKLIKMNRLLLCVLLLGCFLMVNGIRPKAGMNILLSLCVFLFIPLF